MTVHHEQNMKREDQQDAAIRCLLLTSVSTCFGHHYAHLQENKGPITAFGVFVLVLLDMVGSGCGALSCKM
jgi:hypothetical protein